MITIFHMCSRTILLSNVIEETSTSYTLDFPFEMLIIPDMTGANRLYLQRFLPYSNDNKVTIFKAMIESSTNASDTFTTFYQSKVDAFKKATESKLDDPNALYKEGSPSYDDDEDDYHDSDFDDSYATHSSNTTKH